jgi:hypothetical protein
VPEAEHGVQSIEGGKMHALIGLAHARCHLTARRIGAAVEERFRGTASERGQGTVEYVGLILLVSLLMVGMVAAMKGFNNKWPLGGLPTKA